MQIRTCLKSLQLTVAASFFFLGTWAQGGKITGVVLDEVLNEALPMATVSAGEGYATNTDPGGNFTLNVPNGTYVVTINFVTYDTFRDTVVVNNNEVTIKAVMKTPIIGEVNIVADLAKPRETPVAYSNISAQRIQEELGSKDLPLILNSTPGVYATSQGGGDGDARISIRGFNSQNVMVMIDGVPMNDMFNGRVFWTNWFGLDYLTRTIQVQRGLGASKLAIPAIGGTMNIITQGIESERRFSIKQEVGNNLNFRTVLSASSGELKGGWNVQGAFSFKRNDGWVQGLQSEMYFYYFKASKRIKNHILSLQTFGAPQTSGQKSFLYDTPISYYNADYAYQLGVDTANSQNQLGWNHYVGWNYLRRTRVDEGGVNAQPEFLNTTVNQFFKPVISLRDFITVNNRTFLSLVAYASFGKGGGTQLDQALSLSALDSNGRISLQNIYNTNAYGPTNKITLNGVEVQKASNFIRKNHNEHSWYGFLGTFETKLKSSLTLSGGLDFRYYNGRVFSTIADLLGADVALKNEDQSLPFNTPKRVGDRIQQDIERHILWGGAFAMLEYTSSKISAFVNVSTAVNGYKQLNHFAKRTLAVGDTVLNIGYSDTINYLGNTYNFSSPGLQTAQSTWFSRAGYTVKGGMNYNINKNHNVFVNVGYFSRAPMMTFMINAANQFVRDAKNERLTSFEFGYTFRNKRLVANLNLYYTLWTNKPTSVSLADQDGNSVNVNANNMGARHMGIEVDFSYQIIKQLTFEGMLSIGDWIWNKVATAQIYDESGNLVSEKKFDPRGVKVGDAAQHSYSAGLRIEPIKGLYISPRVNFFTHNFANFSPDLLALDNNGFGANIGRDPWRMPDYYYLDVNAGYGFYIKKKYKLDFRASFMNVTNNFYIADAQDSQIGSPKSFSASGAAVNVGLGFRWLGSIGFTF